MEYSCEPCGESFENAFEYVDHITFDFRNPEEFDPSLRLPNGARFMVGSLLRFMYHNAHEPEQVKQIAESSFMTLFHAETEAEDLDEIIEDMVVQSEMMRFDVSLKELLEEEKPDDTENGT